MNRPPPPRFTISSASLSGGIARVGGAELHHLRDVMRLGIGAPVSLMDERGAQYAGIVRCFEGGCALIEVVEARAPEPNRREIILAAAIIKGARMDFLVEKAAEIGASELWPVMCARGVATAPGRERLARWRRLASAAAKQSLAARPMEIRQPVSFGDLIRNLPAQTLGVICTIGAEPLAGLIRKTSPGRILIACGPEGDFDRDEQTIAERAGLVKAGLGRNRLRSETAALAALSVAGSVLEELDGGR